MGWKETLAKNAGNWWNAAIEPLCVLARDWRKLGSASQNNYDAGFYHLSQGNISDAQWRFKIALWLKPTHYDALLGLACCHLAQNNAPLALNALERALKIRPGDVRALELKEAALGNIPPPAPGVEIREAEAGDLDILEAIHKDSFPSHWDIRQFNDIFKTQGTRGLIAAFPGERQALGMIVYRELGDQAEILTLAVRQNHRRRGVARALVRRAMAQARDAGAGAMFLEVAADNVAAEKLYEKEGFTKNNRRKGYYALPDGSRIDALAMSCRL